MCLGCVYPTTRSCRKSPCIFMLATDILRCKLEHTMPDAIGAHICATCSKSYKRREHLQRHTLTHLTTRLYRCNVCGAAFSRTDVLRRHSQTCNVKATNPTTTRSRRACDRCAHQKKACNLGRPCRNCQSKATPCHYSYTVDNELIDQSIPASRAAAESWDPDNNLLDFTNYLLGTASTLGYNPEDAACAQQLDSIHPEAITDLQSTLYDNSTLEWFDFAAVLERNGISEVGCLTTTDEGRKFHFLYNFTSRTGLSTFDCGTPIQRQRVLASLSELQTKHNVLSTVDESVVHPSPQDSSLLDPLAAKVRDIIGRLEEIVRSKPRNSTITLTWTAATEQQCLHFFSPSNIRNFLTSYWAFWHPNVNFVHKPTFDPTRAKAGFVAAMVLIGTLRLVEATKSF